MSRQHLLEQSKYLTGRVNPVHLIKEATPIHTINRFAKSHGYMKDLMIKREDQTDDVYGGNKVRNLEYVLGEALHRKCNSVSTLIPYGSNFTGALAAQAGKVGIVPYLSQFVLQRNSQIEAHVKFGQSHGAQMKTFHSNYGFAGALAHAGISRLNPNRYYIEPGASSVLGALGHANALL
ncbi:MAG: hypothetical protein V4736_13960, partial [Bdellovibrionota bacterium]